MTITPLYNPEQEKRPMNIAAFMSGSGTNVEKILEHQKALRERDGESPYRVVAIFSDTNLRKPGEKKGSRAKIIADEWNKDEKDRGWPIAALFHQDIDVWYRQPGMGCEDKRARGKSGEEKIRLRGMYDKVTKNLLCMFDDEYNKKIDAIALAGYMSFLTEPILSYAPCVNVHPADLRIIYTDPETGKTKRRYTGDHAVRDAIASGESTIRSSVHIATAQVDYGPLLMVSEPLNVILSYAAEGINPNNLGLKQLVEDAPHVLAKVADFNQDRLKERGDWVIFPKTLEMMAEGKFGKDESGRIYHMGESELWVPGEVVLG